MFIMHHLNAIINMITLNWTMTIFTFHYHFISYFFLYFIFYSTVKWNRCCISLYQSLHKFNQMIVLHCIKMQHIESSCKHHRVAYHEHVDMFSIIMCIMYMLQFNWKNHNMLMTCDPIMFAWWFYVLHVHTMQHNRYINKVHVVFVMLILMNNIHYNQQYKNNKTCHRTKTLWNLLTFHVFHVNHRFCLWILLLHDQSACFHP